MLPVGKSLTIALLIPGLRDGGVERAMINLADGLVELGHKVDLLSCTTMDGPLVNEIPAAITCLALGARSSYSASMRLASYVKAKHPSAIFSALTPANVVAVITKNMLRAWRICLPVGIGVQVSIRAAYAPSRLKAKLRPAIYRRCYAGADAIIAASEGVRNELIGIGLNADTITTIFNPVVNSRIRKLSRIHPEHEWFRTHDCPVIIAVGRLHPQKDFLTLLRAFREVRTKKRCRLLILGEGDYRETLERAIHTFGLQGDVNLPGFVTNPYSYMRAADMFVLSSAYEGFGNVVAEALCMGTKVVSTDCPSGPREILGDGKYGKLVPVGDYSSMADAILDGLQEQSPEDTSRTYLFEATTAAKLYLAAINSALKS